MANLLDASADRLLVHVGYVKTGSTWLQARVLNNAQIGFCPAAGRSDVRRLIIDPNPLWYDSACVAAALSGQVTKAAKHGRVPVLTHERLAGSPLTGGHDASIVADRLHLLFPECKIFIVIREQNSHILSIYNEYVAGGGNCTLERFLFPPEGAKIPLFDFRFLEFHRLISYYLQLFGPERVCVLPFELFIRDATDFCRRLILFAGLEDVSVDMSGGVVRPSLGALTVQLAPYFNHIMSRTRAKPAAWVNCPRLQGMLRRFNAMVPEQLHAKARAHAREFVAKAVNGRYRESNALTSKLTGFDLQAFGYDVG